MPKHGAGNLLDGVLRGLEHELSAEDVRERVEEGYHLLAGRGDLPQDVRLDLRLLESLMTKLGWQTYGKSGSIELKQPSLADFPDLDVDNCFARGVLKPGCGRFLDLLSVSGNEADVCMENLLRHVEVKRQKGLRQFSQELSEEARTLERVDVCILFSRFARRRGDLRFLNAALKLNDWFPGKNRDLSDTVRVRQLLALAEQEISVKELLAC